MTLHNAEQAPLTFEVIGSGETIRLEGFRGIVAGYTGRDMAAVQHHIDELAAIGVAPPPEVPMFYPVPRELFGTSGAHEDSDNLTSGEIEPLYIRHNGTFYLGIGSDHTDRDLESKDIGESKRACPKPVSSQVIRVDNLEALSLDDCIARSWVDGSLYQEGTLGGLRKPADVVGLLLQRTDVGDEDFLCLGGTLPLLGGKFTNGNVWRLELQFPDGTTIEHTYKMTKGLN
jgi:4-hydroxyphenylacetate 3-monooxygenase